MGPEGHGCVDAASISGMGGAWRGHCLLWRGVTSESLIPHLFRSLLQSIRQGAASVQDSSQSPESSLRGDGLYQGVPGVKRLGIVIVALVTAAETMSTPDAPLRDKGYLRVIGLVTK